MSTQILNPTECGYTSFFSIGSLIWAQGPVGSFVSDKLQIARVIIVQDATKESRSLFFAKPIMHWDVDLDIYLENGKKIEVHTDEGSFIKKMSAYVWEFQRKNPRVNFYGREEKRGLTPQEKEGLVILMQQVESEKLILAHLMKERDKAAAENLWASYEVQQKQKKVLACQKRIWTLQQRIDKIRAKEF
jgi:hypothetical protein